MNKFLTALDYYQFYYPDEKSKKNLFTIKRIMTIDHYHDTIRRDKNGSDIRLYGVDHKTNGHMRWEMHLSCVPDELYKGKKI